MFNSGITIILSVLFTFALYFPLNDSDALASYVAKYKYAEFGPLEQTATLSLQYVFPDGFNWIVYQFARTGYLAGVPSYIGFLIILWIFYKNCPRERFTWSLILTLCSPLIITQSVSQKDDLFISSMFLLTLYLPMLFRAKIALLLGLVSISIMIGTKWSAIPYAFSATPWLFWQILSRSRSNDRQILANITIAVAPICWMMASGPSYLKNYVIYRTPTPLLSDVSWLASTGGMTGQLRSLFVHIIYNGLDLAKGPLLLFAYVTSTPLSHISGTFDKFSYPLGSLYTSHAPVGITYLLILVGSGMGLMHLEKIPKCVSVSAGIAVIAGVMELFFVNIGGGQLRYLLPTLICLIPFSAYGLEQVIFSNIILQIGKVTAITLCVSTLFLSNDRTLPQPFFPNKASFLNYSNNHSLLMFSGLPGYIDFYEKFQKTVHLYDSLMIVDNSIQADIHAAELPHFYPFLLNRSAANTAIVRTRLDKIDNCHEFRFILVYTRRGTDYICKDYQAILNTGFRALKLYVQ